MNQQQKYILNLQRKSRERKREQAFVIEGRKMFEEAPADRIKMIVASESFCKSKEGAALLKGKKFDVVSDSIFETLSDTKTPQGILAIVKRLNYTMNDLMQVKNQKAPHLVVLDNLQDPGNLGTILRAGEGAGITGLIMSRDTVDLYNPKVIRSTMGSVFRVPFYYTDDLEQTVLDLKARGIRVFAAHLAGKNNYEQEDYTGNTAFLIGNEGNGLTEKLSNLADTWVKIPMAGKVESLNAAIAASILMFETARQRRA